MMNVIERIHQGARRLGKTIVLPEGIDERVVRAAAIAKEKGLARPIVLGKKAQVEELLEKTGDAGVEIIDPEQAEQADSYAAALHELRKKKGLSLEDAKVLVRNPMYYATMMVKSGDADGYAVSYTHLSHCAAKDHQGRYFYPSGCGRLFRYPVGQSARADPAWPRRCLGGVAPD